MSKYGKIYAYKEMPRDSQVVEFGWVVSDKLGSGPIVLSKSLDSPDDDGVATLSDYQNFFVKLTNSSPSKFLEKWIGSPKEYKLFWYNHMPKTEEGTHDFVLKLADLIQNRKPFEHKFSKRLTSYYILDVSDEEKGSSS